MRSSMGSRCMSSAVVLLLALILVLPTYAQEKLQQSPGGYHGELDFPISWSRYYSYAEWTQIMHDIQKQYPHLSDIQSIGKSRMGRDQFLITLAAKSTGADTKKPAMWVDGAIHGNEVNGITCSLYLMWYLLTRYDYDEYVHGLLDTTTFYILPGLNVDANDSFVLHPNTPNNPREPYRPEDNDGDGLYDEDQTEDVDGDGELSTMYIEDPTGEFKLTPDKRRFVAVEDEREAVMRFRRIGGEGYDNDGDGRINEDDIGGPDPNRNYPAGWNLQAGNPFPLSEPETRNAYEFLLAHPNIFASFHFHNTGRIIYFTTPPRLPSSSAQSAAPPRGRRGQQTVEQRLAEMRKTNKYAQLFDIQVPPAYQEDMRVQTEIVTVGARILKNYRPSPSGGNGMAPGSYYDMHGAYSYLMELWGSPAFDADEDGDGRVDGAERLKWIDVELGGEGWIEPHKFDHPDLGPVWIGGTAKKHTRRTPPARYMESEAFKNAQFVMYCASQFPKVEIGEVTITPATGDLFWVDVVLKNDRVYPTLSDRAVQLKNIELDKLTLNLSEGVKLVGLPGGQTTLDPTNERLRAEAITGRATEYRLKGKEKIRFRALIEMSGTDGWIEFLVDSYYGGEAQKKIEIKVTG